jgi:hypothetical protein
VAEEYQSCRQELLVKSAQVLDLQQAVKEAALGHEADVAAAEGQVSEGPRVVHLYILV